MAKIAIVGVIFVAALFCVQAIRIDPLPLTNGENNSQQNIQSTKNDPRCKADGRFANPTDCTKYFVCRNGESQDRRCPEGMKFDSIQFCTNPEEADCGNSMHQTEKFVCPKEFGWFVFPEDCHKYVICVHGKAKIRDCPPDHIYSDTAGSCVPGKVCPKGSEHNARRNNLLDLMRRRDE